MPSREASVRLTLQSGDVIISLKAVGNEAERVGKKAQSALDKGFAAGATAAKRSLSGLADSAKTALKWTLSLGGAMSFAGGIAGAVHMHSKLQDLAFVIETGTKRAISWRDIQKQIAPVAEATGQSAEALADAYRAVFEETGSADLARASMESIGTLATATGRPVEQLAKLAGILGEKFAVSGKEMPEALTKLVEMSSKGGVQFEDLSRVLAMTGASAKAAGLSGQEGLQQMLGLANVADDALGGTGKGIRVITALLDQMAGPELEKKLQQSFQVSTKNARGQIRDLGSVMADVFKKTGGKREKLQLAFSDEQVKFLQELSKPFSATLAATGGDAQKASAALKASMAEAGEGGLTFAAMQKRAAERLHDPERQMQIALDKLKNAFTQPAVIEAMEKLAKALPKLADLLASVVGFAAEHPVVAGGVALGGKVAMDAGMAAAAAAVAAKFAGGAAAGAAGAGAAGAGGAAATGAAGAAATGVKAAIGVAAAPVLGVIAAGLAAHALIKAGREAEGHGGAVVSMAEVGMEASEALGGGVDERTTALESVTRALEEQEARKADTGILEETMAGIGQMLGGGNVLAMQEDEAAKLRSLQEQLAASLAPVEAAKKPEPTEIATRSAEAMGAAVARSLFGGTLKVEVVNPPGAPGGGFGPPAPGATVAGSEAR